MSSGGSNYSTGTTGGGNQVSVDTPASNPASYTNAPAPAPGGKGGFPSAQSPYAQQQPQVYMPPQQPSYYQQAFPQQTAYTQSSFYAPPQQYGYTRQLGLNPERNYRNPYSQQYSPQTPIGAPRPMDEMEYAPGGFGPGQLMSDSWSRRRMNPDDFQPLVQPTYAGPTNEKPQYGGPGPTPPMEQRAYGGPVERTSYPVAATQGVVPEPNYSGGLGSLMSGMSGRQSEPLIGMRDPRINLSPNSFNAPAQPLGWINTPNGRLWNA